MNGLRRLFETLKSTRHALSDEEFVKNVPCQCSPVWPALETVGDGYAIRAVPSSHYSIMTNPDIGAFIARCTVCHARYPDPWVTDKSDRMPDA